MPMVLTERSERFLLPQAWIATLPVVDLPSHTKRLIRRPSTTLLCSPIASPVAAGCSYSTARGARSTRASNAARAASTAPMFAVDQARSAPSGSLNV